MHRLQNNFCIRCIAPLIGEIVRGQFPWEGLFQERGRLLEGRGHPCCLHSLSQKLRRIWGHQDHQGNQRNQGNQGRQEELGQEETTALGFLGPEEKRHQEQASGIAVLISSKAYMWSAASQASFFDEECSSTSACLYLHLEPIRLEDYQAPPPPWRPDHLPGKG